MTWPVTLKLDSAAYPLSVVQRAAYSWPTLSRSKSVLKPIR